MRIAVLLSTYNGRHYLPAQLESLANQTIAENITVYIREDGGPDDVSDIVRQWENKIHIDYFRGENLGPAKSFWSLLMDERIQADYYAFCDQDDVWDRDKLEIAVSKLNEATHFYACNCRLIDGQGALIKDLYQETAPELSIPRLFVAGVVQGCAMVFSHELRCSLIEKKLQCVPMHDIVVMLHALEYGNVVWDQEARFSYRVHSNNVVARENKSFVKKLRTTWWNWKNSSRNSMSDVARELLATSDTLPEKSITFLTLMSNYRSSFRAKIKLLLWRHENEIPFRVLRSYWLRLLVNML